MNLALKRSARMAWTAVMRFGCCLCICGILLGTVAVPKSKAVGAEVIGTAALATSSLAAYMTATGVPLTVVSGGAAAASAGTASLISGYAAATGATYEVVTTAIAAGATVSAGTIVLGAAAVAVLAGIVAWVISEYGLEVGAEPTLIPMVNSDFVSVNGHIVPNFDDMVTTAYSYYGIRYRNNHQYVIYGASAEPYFDGSYVRVAKCNWFSALYSVGGTVWTNYSTYTNDYFVVGGSDNDSFVWSNFDLKSSSGSVYLAASELQPYYDTTSSEATVSLDVDYYPKPELAPDTQVRIDTGVNPELAPEAVPDAIFESIAGNEFSPTYVEEPVTDPDPGVNPEPEPDPEPEPEPDPGSDPDDFPDPESLGLDDLGEALTTRFPFSIPWDLYRAVNLLVAPAEAPYFEIDFLEPLAYRLPGGWHGSTTIVFDMAEYALIGQVSRWTSTVGFCLALIAGSKRFIWMS